MRERGVWNSLKLLPKNVAHEFRWYMDGAFDRKFGTDTSGIIEVSNLDLAGPSAEHAVYYEPTPLSIFRRALSAPKLDPREYVFVDYGCGKGRTLLMASDYPFRAIVGVELSSQLTQVAQRNIEIYRSPKQQCHDIAAVCSDATDFELPDGNLLLYFYTPFYLPILREVNERILAAVARQPRKITILYYTLLVEQIEFLRSQPYVSECEEVRTHHELTRQVQRRLYLLSG